MGYLVECVELGINYVAKIAKIFTASLSLNNLLLDLDSLDTFSHRFLLLSPFPSISILTHLYIKPKPSSIASFSHQKEVLSLTVGVCSGDTRSPLFHFFFRFPLWSLLFHFDTLLSFPPLQVHSLFLSLIPFL